MISKAELEGFSKRFDVVSCFLERDGRILMLHRQDAKPQGNTWSMPAGKVDPGDPSFEAALAREIREELGIGVDPESLERCASYFVRHDGYDFEYHVYSLALSEAPDIELNLSEHKAFRWMTPAEALALGDGLMPDEDACIKDRFGL